MEAIDLNQVFAISGLVNGITSIALGVVVFMNGPRKAFNQVFALFALSMAVWSGGYYFWLLSDSAQEALLWVKIFNIGAVFIPVLQYHWVTHSLSIRRQTLLRFGYSIAVIFAVLPFTRFEPYYIANITDVMGFNFWPEAGILYAGYILFDYILFFTLGFVEAYRIQLYRTDKVVHGIARQLLWVVAFGPVAGLTNFPLWYGLPLIPYGNFFVFLYVFILAYAIFKYNYMKIRQGLVSMVTVIVSAFLLVDVLISETIVSQITRFFALIIFLYFAFLMYRSFEREMEEREKSQKLSTELQVVNERLIRLDKAKSDMLSIAAHQLRTPLTAMNGYMSLVLDGSTGEKLGATTSDMLTKVSRATGRLSTLVNNLLNMSRIDDGRMQYAMEPTQIEELITETAGTFDVLAQAQGLTLKLDLPSAPLAPVLIDDGKMHEVISNLINNAIKYTKEGSITVRVWQHDPQHVRFSVRDTGVGVPQDVIGKLFSKFSRADRQQMNTEGAGIGLYVCYNIVRDHGGRIWVDSDGEGKGSEFIVELRIAETQKSAEMPSNEDEENIA